MITPLKKWMYSKRMSRQEFADKAGVTYFHMIGILSGKKIPGEQLAYIIEDITEGAIPMSSWKGAKWLKSTPNSEPKRRKCVK